MSWTDYDDVESDPGKLGGTPVMKGTRVPVDAILNNFDSFLDEELTPYEAELAVLACFPHVAVERIRGLVAFRAEHEAELNA